jgi:hypothetical protein
VKWNVWSAKKENTEALLVTSKGIGAEANTETTKCVLVFVNRTEDEVATQHK